MLTIGSVVDGKYKILSEIGHGGMSVVYLAINVRANKTWAIKEVRKDGVSDYEVVRQGLVVETEMLKKLNHPHLPSIIDVIDGDDSFLIVMDYIEGKSLQSLIKHGGAQEPDRVIEWAKQLCDVLGYLHSRVPPIIYRDMKPANVMLKPDGSVTLIDFGTAREYKSQNVADTTCLGTRGYAAPEQFGGHGQTDGRTDIYCLGATIYHLLTGHSPCEPPYEIKRLGYWNPKFIGSGLEKLVSKCTRQNPAERYQTCAELMYALEHIHDADDVVLRKRRRMWGGFIASIAVTLAGVVGMLGFHIAESSTTAQSYDSYIRQAGSANNFVEAIEYYKKAMDLKPSSPDAYTALLDRIEQDLTFTGDENTALLQCITHITGNTRDNLDYLKTSNKEAYAEFSYRLANDYYFFYEGSDSRTKAATWYAEVKDSTYLTDQELSMANSLYTIGEYYASLGSDKSALAVGESSNNYKTFWDSMVQLTDGDLTVKTGRSAYAVGLYKELAYQIYNNAGNFKQFGVTKEEMLAQLDKDEAGLKTLPATSESVRAEIAEIQTTIMQARDQVKVAYAGVGGATGG